MSKEEAEKAVCWFCKTKLAQQPSDNVVSSVKGNQGKELIMDRVHHCTNCTAVYWFVFGQQDYQLDSLEPHARQALSADKDDVDIHYERFGSGRIYINYAILK